MRMARIRPSLRRTKEGGAVSAPLDPDPPDRAPLDPVSPDPVSSDPDPWTRLTRVLQQWRWPLLALFIACFATALTGLGRLGYDPDVMTYFDPKGEDRRTFEAVEDRFGRTNEVVYVVRARQGTVLDAGPLRRIETLRDAAGDLSGAIGTRSTLDLLSRGGETVSLPPDRRALPALGETIDRAATEAGTASRALLSEDRTVGVVAVRFPRAVGDGLDLGAVVDEARAVRDRVVAETTDVDVMMTGRMVIDAEFERAGRDETQSQVAVQVVVITVVVALAMRSLTVAAALLALSWMATVIAAGALGWAGTTLTGVSSSMPAVLLGVGVATGVHVTLAWQRHCRALVHADLPAKERSRRAVEWAMRENALPVTLSLLTTALSFLCLNLAESPPFRQLGNVTAFGLAVLLVLSFTLLPTVLLLLPPRATPPVGTAAMAALGRWVARLRWPLLVLGALSVVLAAWGASRLTFDDVFSHYFDERYEVRRATDLFEEQLVGTTILVAALPAEPGRAREPDTLERVADFRRWALEQEGVSVVSSPDPVATDDPGQRDFDATESGVRVEMVLRGVSSADTLRFAQAAGERAGELFGEGVVVTGLPILSAQLSTRSARTMLVATGVALAAISVLMFRVLGSVRLGFAALLPNLAPMLIAFGLWGVLVGEVSFAATIVATLTFGIVVDDTIHFMVKYRALRGTGCSPGEAVERTMGSVGLALVVTSIAIGLGFAMFANSGFLVNQHFGILSALTIGAALVADLLFLPPLLIALARRAN